ncbi:MAG: hypothetical protein GX024_03640 [Clostridiales bacterium]|nr:hypothetical protein [Clostridiales bacterium]
MRFKLVILILLCLLVGCSNKAVIPMSSISYDTSETNRIVLIEEVNSSKPVFELYGNGFVRKRSNIFQEELENGKLSKKQIRQLLNYIINKQRVGDLESSYPEDTIPGIEMYPNPELYLDIRIDRFNKHIRFAYSNVGDQLEYFKEEERINEETFKELDKLRSIFRYLMEYKINKEG